MNLFNKIKNMVKFGRVTNVDSDDKQFPQSQITAFNKTREIITLYPYGTSGNAPVDNMVLIVNVANEENSVALPFSSSDREKNLKEGEYACGNWVVGSVIKFDAEGNITINATAKVIINSDVDINGDLNVVGKIGSTGSMVALGSVTGAGVISSVAGRTLDAHVHVAVGDPGETGPPV